MIRVKHILFLVFAVFAFEFSIAQQPTVNKNKFTKLSNHKNELFLSQPDSNAVSPVINPEPIPTPEDQGFTLYEVEGKTFYRKIIDGVIIEFSPKKD